jgi:cytochrome P450
LLVEHPEQLAAVVADPTLSIRAVEETLRYLTPVKGLYRNTTEDAEIDGVRIGAGDLVVPMWGSGNRDETRFDRAEEFDIFRPESEKHMAFSRYAHFCLGAPLARLEAAMALELAVELLPNVRRADDGPLDWLPMPMHSGLSRLRLAWDA